MDKDKAVMNLSEAKAKVKEVYNIVDLVEQESVTLSISGPGEYKGLCPFHNEKTPSFKVSEPFQNYICFGCGATGDIFSFIQETRGCSFVEALKFLAESKGIEITDAYSKDEKPKVDLKRMYELIKDTDLFYRSEFDKLDNSHPAKKQIIDRGLDINNKVFGYAPERYGALYEHLKAKGYSDELMLQSELICEKDGKYFDFFYRRLTITLADFSGRPVSYSARKLFENDTRGKYVNGKASPVFQKKATLFNLNLAKKTARLENKIILSEGPFDVLAIVKSGYENAVASCGTAFTEEHLKAARQLVGESGELIFAFDGDSAGIEAAMKIFLHFPVAHSISKVALFPEGKDPCDYLQSEGAEAVKEIIDNAKPLADFVLRELANHIELTDMDSRYRFIKTLVSKYLTVVTDKILLEYLIRKASVMSGIEMNKITALYSETKNSVKTRKITEPEGPIHQELKLKIELNNLDESDLCYVRGLSLLVRYPLILAPKLSKFTIPEKFLPFLHEYKNSVNKTFSAGHPYRFIYDEYDDQDFAKLLQQTSEKFLVYNDDDTISHHFDLIMTYAEAVYIEQMRQNELSRISAALADAKTPQEIAELLTLREQTKTKR